MVVTLDLPDELVKNIMELTHTNSQSDGIRLGLENLIKKETSIKLAEKFGKTEDFDIDNASKSVDMSQMVRYFGKLDLSKDIDLNILRERNSANQ
jgi:hypothetical protein